MKAGLKEIFGDVSHYRASGLFRIRNILFSHCLLKLKDHICLKMAAFLKKK